MKLAHVLALALLRGCNPELTDDVRRTCEDWDPGPDRDKRNDFILQCIKAGQQNTAEKCEGVGRRNWPPGACKKWLYEVKQYDSTWHSCDLQAAESVRKHCEGAGWKPEKPKDEP